MIDQPDSWEHKSGYHLNADGKSIEYVHEDKPQYKAVIEAMVNEDEKRMEYYIVLFNTKSNPWETIEPHETFIDKDSAIENFCELMEEYQ